MFRNPALCLALCAGLAGPALAGIPTEQTVTCPVGGEQFEITGTASCTTYGRTMSFRMSTSCDFVTRLPVCPSNGLPMYRDYSEAEVARLTELVDSEDWEQWRALSPWLRAHAVAVHLGEEESEVTFNLLLNGHWSDPEGFAESVGALDLLVAEAEAEKARVEPQLHPLLNAIVAYALFGGGRAEEGAALIEAAREADPDDPFIAAYVEQVGECGVNVGREGCRPSDPVPDVSE